MNAYPRSGCLAGASELILTGNKRLVNANAPDMQVKQTIAPPAIDAIVGVDFSGARESGKTAWMARLEVTHPLVAGESNRKTGESNPELVLTSLRRVGRLAGSDAREHVNAYLCDRISAAKKTLWGCDFPFGLPIELKLGDWPDQLSQLAEFAGTAKEFGLALVARSESLLGGKHVRRLTDKETQTPFDCYHYRIIYQTFHGMRDVLGPVAEDPDVCVLPFQYEKLFAASTIVVEACPSSTLKRSGLPHQRYKQSGGKPPESLHRTTRREILSWLGGWVEISRHRRRVIMQDPGGDALDAVLAGVGAWQGFNAADHSAIACHHRYPIEGRVFC
jgi:hypothetical protein